MWLSLVIGAIGSLIASAIFLLIMCRVRSNLELSSKIAKTIYNRETVYSIKIINSGKRDVVAIRAELLMIEPQVVHGGIGKNILQIPLVRDEWFLLEPISKNDDDFGSFEFITTENIDEEWGLRPNAYLLFRVHAQDSISGFSKIFSTKYYSRSDIVQGRFAKGASMLISN
jgi:hypothetical protein